MGRSAKLILPRTVWLGPGSLERLGEEAARLGRKALLVTGRSALRETGATDRITAQLAAAGVAVELFDDAPPEPDVACVDRARGRLREAGCDLVVEAGGAWTSVTPGSQQYWLQAFSNVLHGRWKKIDPGFGRSVLGYFGQTPLPPDPEVVKAASEQLELPVFDGDPLEAAPKNIEPARKALEERTLPVSDKNIFLVMA